MRIEYFPVGTKVVPTSDTCQRYAFTPGKIYEVVPHPKDTTENVVYADRPGGGVLGTSYIFAFKPSGEYFTLANAKPKRRIFA